MTDRHCTLLPLVLSALLAMSGCGWIEDDLSGCPQKGIVEVDLHLCDTLLSEVWGIDSAAWSCQWHYGWDSKDRKLWGPIGYTRPDSYEALFMTLDQSHQILSSEQETVNATTFRHSFPKGTNGLLVWSNVSTSQGVQSLEINDEQPAVVEATSATAGKNKTGDLVSYAPDIFYQGSIRDILITGQSTDYDYYDNGLKEWVKHLDVELTPMVDIYLTQIIIFNNNNRIYALNGDAVISNFARSVCVNDRIPGSEATAIAFPMRIKRNISITTDDKTTDIIGGRFTTFGLCPAQKQLRNRLSINLTFSNQKDSTFTFDLTTQVQARPKGGILTVELDMDTIRSPSGTGGGSTFDPWVKEYSDSITRYFDI